jgi:hypothetical protein
MEQPEKKKGFQLKPTKVVIQKATEEFKEQKSAAEETTEVKPSPVTTATREMFKAAPAEKKAMGGPGTAPGVGIFTKPLAKAEAKPGGPLAKADEPLAKAEARPSGAVAKAEEKPKEVVKRKEPEPMAPLEEVDLNSIVEEEDKAIAKKYKEEERANPYTSPETNEPLGAPSQYLMENNRGFSDFIKMTYDDFSLKPVEESAPVAPGDKYPYQKFIREYMREASPYRGVLVYHGLGSGKTCTAIAASEALFSTANKKIIVMTPFSLRKNFLSEVSFCGFRHFHLKNYWVSYEKDNALFELFAKQVLNLSDNYLRTAKKIWVPDLNKSPEESNYDSLPEDGKKELRKQILAQLVWDKDKNPTGRIRFINYNGISARALKELACKSGPNNSEFFDDAVIVVDEIHNLIRLMQGEIDPYLTLLPTEKKVKRRIQLEKVEPGHWNPSLCESPKNYKRGYMFYRLLMGAQRSKIIGLSGTPLINFPEELGILANVLHGYIHTLSGTLSGSVNNVALETLLKNHLYFDFVEVKGNEFLVSLLPEGIRKIANSSGVERIPRDETLPTIQELIESIKKTLKDNSYKLTGEITLKSFPLIPPFGDEFRSYFLNKTSIGIINEILLSKRLTGLISYYKGSRQDLMPRIAKDEIVRCPFSPYAQGIYSLMRTSEILKEKNKKSQGEGGAWTEVYDLGDNKESSSYRIDSRQICNFAFPPSVTRPSPKSKKDKLLDTKGQRDIPDSAPGLTLEEEGDIRYRLEIEGELEDDDTIVEDEEEEEEKDEGGEEDEEEEEEDETIAIDPGLEGLDKKTIVLIRLQKLFDKLAAKEKDAFETLEKEEGMLETYTLTIPLEEEELRLLDDEFTSLRFHPTNFEISLDPIQKGEEFEHLTELFEKATKTAKEFLEEKKKAALPKKFKPRVKGVKFAEGVKEGGGKGDKEAATAGVKKSLAQLVAERQAKKAEELASLQCKGEIPGEDYAEAQIRAKTCLREKFPETLAMTEEGLGKYSSKYLAMLKNIQEAPGSSLVYSAFLNMEGLGIFQIAMDLAGYVPIVIEADGGSFRFSSKTIKSLRKGPGAEPRYMTFSGGELDDVRKLSLNIFNANFGTLPEAMKRELTGYTDNKTGQLCRVFCITSAGAEGLSLKNVRAVHIMEPHWNDVRLQQVKGRAIRLGSHLDLPEDQRDVSIYTYISCFSEEAQKAESGPLAIDVSIWLKDGKEKVEDLRAMGIQVPAGLGSYVITSDEHLLMISKRKKLIIDELQNVMKSVAIDCQLNMAQNKDGTYQCFSLKGNVGDFLYHPDISVDKLRTESEYKFKKAEVRTGFSIKLSGRPYKATEVKDTSGKITGFELFDPSDVEYKTLLGKMGVNSAGKPAKPVELF